MKTVYLGRDNQTFGPFTEVDLQKMTQTGELATFQWIWESEATGWQQISAPPPPPPSLDTAIPKSELPFAERRAKPRPVGTPIQEDSGLQVICHDLTHMMAATLRELDSTGGTLVSKDFSEEIPPFKRGGRVWLHLLNPETQLSEKAEAKIVRFTRNEGRWEYRVTWVQQPVMLGGQKPTSLSP